MPVRRPARFIREPSDWGLGLTPAETISDPRGPNNEKRKTVRFVAPVVTEVQYFHRWFNDEYRDSGRYWSTGPHRKSTDLASQAEDDVEIERVEFPERFVGEGASEVCVRRPNTSTAGRNNTYFDREILHPHLASRFPLDNHHIKNDELKVL